MKKLLFPIVLSLVAALILAPSVGAQQGVTVRMEDNYFDRAEISVPAGTTVTWVQAGENPHTTTSYDGLWDSGLIQGGTEGTFSYTFGEPGAYTYFCGPHEDQGMVGTVTVTGSTEAAAGDQELAATGGPSLLLPAAVIVIAAGLAGWAVLRRVP